jgi:hypothetical protein
VSRVALSCACAALLACAVAPTLRDPAKSGVYGYLRLVPHEGVSHQGTTAGGSSAYGDRRYSGAGLVDYSKPGFAVVYLDGPPSPAPSAPLVVTLRSEGAAATLAPANGALGIGGELVVRNAGAVPHVVSIPAASVLRALAPGDSLAVTARESGALEIFVPGASSAASRVFVAPGPFAVVTDAGRFELLDVEPGARRLHAWHPRLPPSARPVELSAGRVVRVDIEVGVGLAAQDAADAR